MFLLCFFDGIIKFYIRFVDVLAKPVDFEKILLQNLTNLIKIFLKFTMDTFDDGNVHFLDIKIDRTETDVYFKPMYGLWCVIIGDLWLILQIVVNYIMDSFPPA